MIEDIQAVQRELEDRFFAMQPVIEKTAVALAETDPDLMRNFLTQYSVGQAEEVVRRWRELGEFLLTKYNDGYVNGDDAEMESGYPESWLREVVGARPDQFRLDQPETPENALPY
jgi:hypothetical protein